MRIPFTTIVVLLLVPAAGVLGVDRNTDDRTLVPSAQKAESRIGDSVRVGTHPTPAFKQLDIEDSPEPEEAAAAIGISGDDLISASFEGSDSRGIGVVRSRLGDHFPTEGGEFLILSTGLAESAGEPNDEGDLSFELDGLNNSQGNDLVQFLLQLNVPAGMNCMSFDFAFYSEEFPEYVGSEYNDTFIAELGGTDSTVEGNTVTAPLNFAFDTEENIISVNSVFGVQGDTGTTYDGVTPLLRATTPVTPGTATEVYFSVMDLGDSLYDSAVMIDKLFWSNDPYCGQGSQKDSDGDGLLDVWETNGLTVNVNGEDVFVDLHAMGAQIDTKDIFVEVDYMEADDHSHRPTLAAMQRVVEAFKTAPVDCDPTPCKGINLHIDCGSDCIMDPRDDTPWGDYSASDSLRPPDERLGSHTILGTYRWSEFDDIKNGDGINTGRFSKARAAVFHYCVFAHNIGKGGTSGLSRSWGNTGASDFIVSLVNAQKHQPGDDAYPIRIQYEAGTFMHELGHNLGLTHGGQDLVNYKPNYLSVMNYLYQLNGLYYLGTPGKLDYSRFSNPEAYDLDELHLDETAGLGWGGATDLYGVVFFCSLNSRKLDTTSSSINWNCNETDSETDVSANINAGISWLEGSHVRTTLRSYNDWEDLIFTGGAIGQPGANVALPAETEDNELTFEVQEILDEADPSVWAAGHYPSYVAAVAHVSGVGGTNWVSDVVIHNPNDDDVLTNIYFLPTRSDNSSTKGLRLTIPTGQSVELHDVVLETFNEDDAVGSMLVGGVRPLIVSSRSFNDSAQGTFGQYVPGLDGDQTTTEGVESRLIQLTGTSRYRTNLGFQNPHYRSLGVDVDLFRATGSHISSRSFEVSPYGHLQINDVLGTNTPDAYAIIHSSTDESAYFAYASIVDNQSGDPILVLPSTPVSSQPLYIPASAHAGGIGGTVWLTDLEVHNPGSLPASYNIEFLRKGADNSVPESRNFTLQPSQSARYEDAVLDLFSTVGTGAIRVSPVAGTIMATSRTYNNASSGTFGQFIPGIPEAGALHYGGTARLVQLSRSGSPNSGYRTNIGFTNATDQDITVEVELFDRFGMSLGLLGYELLPFEHNQINDIFRELTQEDVTGGVAVARTITQGARVFVYASVVDNGSGDPIFILPSLTPGTPTSPPTAAPILTATAVSESQINLSWTSVPGATEYAIWRGPAIIQIQSSLTYQDTGLSAHTTYCYRVQGFNDAGNGPASDQECATTLGGGPESAPELAVSSVGPTSVGLSWTSVNGATEYHLYEDQTRIYAGPDLAYQAAGLEENHEYCYRVIAHNVNGDGPASMQRCALTNSDWESVDIPPGVGELTRVTHGNGIFVAVGGNSVISSPDGTTWSATEIGYGDLFDVCWGAHGFVAVGTAGSVVFSPDGAAWTMIDDVAGGLYGITWGGGRYVAVGWSQVITSVDGRNWTSHPIGDDLKLRDVVWDGNRYLAVGGDVYLNYAVVMSSLNGETWLEVTRLPPNLGMSAVSWKPSDYVGLNFSGFVFVSSDGSDWVLRETLLPGLEDIDSSDNGFLAVGSSGGFPTTVYSSPDANEWLVEFADYVPNGSVPYLRGIATSGTTAVAVGGENNGFDGYVIAKR